MLLCRYVRQMEAVCYLNLVYNEHMKHALTYTITIFDRGYGLRYIIISKGTFLNTSTVAIT